MSNIVPDEKILCFNCYKAYYQKVIEDFVFTDKKGQVITVPDVFALNVKINHFHIKKF